LPDRRTATFRAVMDALHLFRAHRLPGHLAKGRGFALTLHHVRPAGAGGFAPNHLLEVTPGFLDMTIRHVRAAGYDFVSLDEAWARLGAPQPGRPFCALTFDDGYRNFVDHALPVLRRHRAPAALFVASAFADATGDLWWLALEEVLRRATSLVVDLGAGPERFDTVDALAKARTWQRLMKRLRAMPEARMRTIIAELAAEYGVDRARLIRAECLSWDELAEVAREPLVTIGAHTVNHYMLAKWPSEVVTQELERSRRDIVDKLGITPRHAAFPVGDPSAAGPREFEIARLLGFTTAWTTRAGHLFPEHRDPPPALPRVSLNGHFQAPRYLDLFVAGTPFLLWNRGRRLNVA
jgi:peptidoglycan/xylan/chitin deacetylase (PgdA/CDA1 family)